MSVMTKDRDWQLAILAGVTKVEANTEKMATAFHTVMILSDNAAAIPSFASARFIEFFEILSSNFDKIHTWISRNIELEQPLIDPTTLQAVLELIDRIDLDIEYDAKSLDGVVNGKYTLTFEDGFKFTQDELPQFQDIVADIHTPIKYIRTLIFTIAKANDLMEEMGLDYHDL